MRIRKTFTLNMPGGESSISDAFGLSDGKQINICDFDLPDTWQVLLIMGESGSGKTTILREITPEKPLRVPDGPLFLWGGSSEPEKTRTVSILSRCGLSDATHFVSSYSQLSDSQKARASVALQVIWGRKLIVVDEFLSTLDRTTAKATAYCIQKLIRAMGLRLVATTAHTDLVPYLMPDMLIEGKAYPSRFTCCKLSPDLSINPFLKQVNLKYLDKSDYRECSLGDLHYKGKYTGGTKDFLFADMDGRHIGVLVGTYNRTTGGRRISRLIVHPSFRGTGIGKALVSKYIKDFPNTDVLATMGRFNPVFERAGMVRIPDSVYSAPKKLKALLSENGFDTTRWHDKAYCVEECGRAEIREIVARFAGKAHDLICPGGKYLTQDELAEKIRTSDATAGRVLFNLRDRTLAKYCAPDIVF